jgi:hypothetical protein
VVPLVAAPTAVYEPSPWRKSLCTCGATAKRRPTPLWRAAPTVRPPR